jgi:hypothetical protein
MASLSTNVLRASQITDLIVAPFSGSASFWRPRFATLCALFLLFTLITITQRSCKAHPLHTPTSFPGVRTDLKAAEINGAISRWRLQ